MIDENIGAHFGMPEITVITDYSITPELAETCYDMGEIPYYGDLAVDLQTYKNKFYAIPDFCFVFMHKETKKPVGYFIILPLTDDAITRYLDDKLFYSTMQPNDLKKPEDESLYNLFFDTSVLYKEYRTQNMARLVFSLLINAIIERARRFSYCNYILIDQAKEFTGTIAEALPLKPLKPHRYPNGTEGHLWGALFDYKNYKRLPNYNVLNFAYNNKMADKLLENKRDLWEMYLKNSPS
ncbi:MAG: hypothetical protein FWE53_03115 [Firmicutes bacterium]|nr:hypothetical protein [Bacillota bacterium]